MQRVHRRREKKTIEPTASLPEPAVLDRRLLAACFHTHRKNANSSGLELPGFYTSYRLPFS
jgi:hypothetical protein